MSDGLAAYAAQLAGRLRERFGDLVVAVWAGGSLALDDVRDTSDLDVAVALDREPTDPERRQLVEILLAAAQDVPARGLEAVVYSREDLRRPGRGDHRVNVNGGPGMATHVGGPDEDPGFWFVIDLAILRAAGRAVVGPPPDELIAEVPGDAVRDALRRSLRWHREHGGRPDHEVLNACRAWHHVGTGGWASKSEAARWAAGRLRGAERAAVEAAAGRRVDPDRPGPSDDGARAVSGHVLRVLGPEVHRLAAFAEHPGGGNPAGVVLTSSALPRDDMQRIAAEVGYSETAFLVPTSTDRRDWEVRYFAPDAEVPFCGHATIAAGVVLGREVGTGGFVLDTVGGAVEVDVAPGDDGAAVATLTSVTPAVDGVDPDLLTSALEALRLDRADLDGRHAPAVAYAGAWHLILVLADRAVLAGLDYDFGALRSVMEDAGLTTVALLWREHEGRWHARNAFPVGGVVEDPATGAAAAAFGAYLRERGDVDPPAEVTILQGHDMGRPSVLTVGITPGDAGIRVSGTAEDIAP